MSETELKKIISGDIESLGHTFESNKGKKYRKNTHHYKNGEKYLHFFKHESSMKMMSYLYREVEEKFFFCSFNIPFSILALHSGKGFYPSSGYDNEELKEYAIPLSQFKPEYLISYELDKTRKNTDLEHVLIDIYKER
jgi:hypothetical protein